MQLQTQSGFSLIELLGAMGLSTLLIAGLSQLYVLAKHNHQLITAITDINNDSLYISDLLMRRVQHSNDVYCPNDPVYSENSKIRGSSSAYLTSVLGRNVLANSDVFIMKTCQWYQRRWQWVTMYYYLARTRRYDAAGQSIYALYQKINNAPRRELVASIVRWKIYYGVSLLENNLRYVDYAGVSDWARVRLIKFVILFKSRRYRLKKNSWYWFITRHHAADAFLYRPLQFQVMVQ